MAIFLGISILALWGIALVLMMRGAAMVPVLVTLAVVWGVITGAGPKILTEIIDGGILSYAGTTMVIILGAWMAETLVQTGIAETLIRNAAELAGDNPIAMAIVMVLVITFLFTSLYGVGAAVMIGVIALPIMLSMGIPTQVAAPLFTMSIIAGIQLSLVEWGIWSNLFKITNPFNDYFWLYIAQLAVWVVMACVLAIVKIRAVGPVRTHSVRIDSGYGTQESTEGPGSARKAPWFALLTPVIPVAGVMLFKWPVTAAFLIGVACALLATIHHRSFKATVDLFQKAFYDGFRSMAPVCAVWLIIGCIIKASSLPEVQAPLKALLGGVLPSSPTGVVVLLAVAAPLAIYRGPMCLAGVGAALVPIFLSMKSISPGFLLGAWKGTNYVHGTTDPINSWTLWTLGYLKISGAQHIRTALPFTWIAAAISATVALLVLGG